MSATLTAPETASREELRTFHVAGRGLDRLLPAGKLQPILPEEVLAQIPPLESVYPVSLPTEGASAPFRADSLALLHGAFLNAGRAPARAAFLLALRQAVAHLRDLLAVDDAKRSPASLDNVAASLGETQRFLSVSSLMSAFGRHRTRPAGMDAARRRRCETALATLEQALRDYQNSPVFWLFHAEGAPEGLHTIGGSALQSSDPCADALAFCNRQLSELPPVLCAIRLAKLEALSAYDPATHDEALNRFDWQTAEPEELAALPAVVVLETPERLAETSLTSLSRLLRSGKPIQVLIPSAGLSADGLSGSVADFGALALAHRGAFVLQSSMARWEHLSQALSDMVRTLHPAIAVVSVPPAGEDPASAWQETSLLSFSQAFPLYCYRPDREGGWTDRFELSEPGPACAALTPIDALLPSPRFRHHFRLIPAEAWDRDQLELHEYLARYKSAPPLVVPFVSVTDDIGTTQRLAVTRELVHLCFDRGRAWEMLSALAAKPAAVDSKPTDLVRVDSNAPAAAAIREAAAKEAYLRVVALLSDPQSL